MNEQKIRADIVCLSKSLFERGLTSGSSGNISARLDNGFIVTPTNSCLGFLTAETLTKLDKNGEFISGDKATKELPLHLSFYQARPSAMAIVHTHSTYSTLLSCRADVNHDDCIPPLTPYVVMRVGKVPILPYVAPGSDDIIPYILDKAKNHAALLLGNHGAVVSGASVESAFYALEELEETAKLIHLSEGFKMKQLEENQVAHLLKTWGCAV
jgi:3-dehydro-4-phosphotetronate decarboxylase